MITREPRLPRGAALLRAALKQPWAWLLLISVGTALVAAARTVAVPSPGATQWAAVQDYGETASLSVPDFLLAPPSGVLIWRPSPDQPLVATPLNQPSGSLTLLPYPDVAPRRWQVAPASTRSFHIFWLEQDRRLRSALVDSLGQTLRGPISLAAAAQPDFVVLPTADGRGMALWIDARTAHLMAAKFDPEGRPEPANWPQIENVAFLAAALDRDDHIRVAWLTSPSPGQWTIHYHNISAARPVFDQPDSLFTFSLEADETLTGFQIGLDLTHTYLFWTTTTAPQPDIERVHVLSFSLTNPEPAVQTELTLSSGFSPDQFPPPSELVIGRIAPAEPSPAHPADLRWIRPAPGQHDILPLAMALRTPEGWRPAVAYYRGGVLLGYQIIAPYPADAAPPTLKIDRLGDLHLAWSGLQGTAPHQYTAATNGLGLIAVPSPHHERFWQNIGTGLARLPFGLLWLALPTCVVLLDLHGRATIPLAGVLYSGSKLFWPPDLVTRIPGVLDALGFVAFRPEFAVGLAMALIGSLAAGVFALSYRARRPIWQSWLAYALPDMLLTWVVFGTNPALLTHHLP